MILRNTHDNDDDPETPGAIGLDTKFTCICKHTLPLATLALTYLCRTSLRSWIQTDVILLRNVSQNQGGTQWIRNVQDHILPSRPG